MPHAEKTTHEAAGATGSRSDAAAAASGLLQNLHAELQSDCSHSHRCHYRHSHRCLHRCHQRPHSYHHSHRCHHLHCCPHHQPRCHRHYPCHPCPCSCGTLH
ncbi:unnamed protein product [Closterium sp. NIES-53]